MIGRREDLVGHTTLIKKAGRVLVSLPKEGMEMKWSISNDSGHVAMKMGVEEEYIEYRKRRVVKDNYPILLIVDQYVPHLGTSRCVDSLNSLSRWQLWRILTCDI